MRTSLLTTCLLSLPTAWGLNYATNVTYSYGSGANAGPGNVTSVVFTYSGQNAGPGGFPTSINTKPITYRGGAVMTGDTINVYVVFYGAKVSGFDYFTAGRQQIVLDFINNVGSTAWYAVAKRYGIANNVKVAKSVYVNCYNGAFAYGCDVGINQVEMILYDQLYSVEREGAADYWWKLELDKWGYGLPRDPNGIYLVIGGPETTEAFANDGGGAKIGRDYCGYHSTFSTKHVGQNEDSNIYKYGYVEVPNLNSMDVGAIMWSLAEFNNIKPASRCFFDRNKQVSPNGEPQIDMAIGLIGHELLEILISPDARTSYYDDDHNEVMDKCESWFSDLKSINNYDYNMEVGGRRYLVSPVWDLDTQKCVMSKPTGSSVWTQVGGLLMMTSVSGNKVCGVNSGHDIFCATYGQGDWSIKPGKLKWISIDGNRACGVNVYDDIFCAENVDNPNWIHIGGKLKQIDLHGSVMCGVNSVDNIFCANFMQGNWRLLPGALMQISVYGNRICGVTSSHTIFCADDLNNVSWNNLPGLLKQLDVFENTICGVNGGNEVFCTPYRSGAWVKKDGTLKHVSIGASIASGISPSDGIFFNNALF